MRKVAIVTGTRAEYGLLYWVIKGVYNDPGLKLQLIVTGAHLSPQFGLTVKDIEFPITEKVRLPLCSDTEEAIAQAIGQGIIGFSKAYKRLRPDMLVVLGDRFEILSAVAAALPFRIPIAHIHGGESTEGLIDEAIRHAVTKMSHIHFVAAEQYKRKVIQMGELPERVFCFGAPGLDNIFELNLMAKNKICTELQVPLREKVGVVTYHPVTLEKNCAMAQMDQLLSALKDIRDVYWVFTLPNIEAESNAVVAKIKGFISRFPKRARLFASLGCLRYLSLLKSAAVMVGNSSSGLIEAPSLKLPVVNIGDRQRGRLRAKNVIDVPFCKSDIIIRAIERAVSPEFKNSLRTMHSPYGKAGASKKIVDKIKTLSLGEGLLKKRFYEVLR